MVEDVLGNVVGLAVCCPCTTEHAHALKTHAINTIKKNVTVKK